MQGEFGRQVRAYRKLKSLTQQELADRLGVSVAIIGSIERGNRMPEAELLQKLQKTLNLPATSTTFYS